MTIRLELDGKTLEGQAMAHSATNVHFLGRDGVWHQFSPNRAKNYSKLFEGFRGFTQSEMRGALQREFGSQFQVSGTGHYLVVHPAGQRDAWAPRFEKLYRSFSHYFGTRGLRPKTPDFPLVAVVFPTFNDFARYGASVGERVSRSQLGYYSPTSNRILLYDITKEYPGQDWTLNAETIIHEATHQTAFNTMVHNRFSQPPRWVAEGLATMFEAPGVYDSQHYRDRSQRVNPAQLELFRRYVPRRPTGSLASFIETDRLFRTNSTAAYAEAWALTFFLSETQHGKYVKYLRATTQRPQFTVASSSERLAEFTSIFGSNLAVMEAHFLRFMRGL